MNCAVERSIEFICNRYSEPLSLADVAGSALLSRFHFSRVFRNEVGITPGRFLSAVRIYQAKRKLATTTMNITDIAFAVGYNSLGSFNNHFSASVGVSPGRFRRLCRDSGPELPRRRQDACQVSGLIVLPPGYAGASVYIGAFTTPIVQYQPVSATVLEMPAGEGSAPFDLRGIQEGEWFIHAVAVADSDDPEPWTRRSQLVGGTGLIRVDRAGLRTTVQLRTRRPTDLPVLLALPKLEARLAASPATGIGQYVVSRS